MKSIIKTIKHLFIFYYFFIKTIKQTDYKTIITTKSNIVKVYEFETKEQNNKFYQSHS